MESFRYSELLKKEQEMDRQIEQEREPEEPILPLSPSVVLLPPLAPSDAPPSYAEAPHSDYEDLLAIGYNIDFENEIGEGAFGSVYGGICTDDAEKIYPIDNYEAMNLDAKNILHIGNHYYVKRSLDKVRIAVKFAKGRNIRGNINLKEAEIMIQLSHPNVVEIYNVVVIENSRLYILMELADFGSLWDVLQEFGRAHRRLSEDMVNISFKQLTAGLKYLHDNGIVHRDIHSANVLVFKDDSNGKWILKFADFGVANVMRTNFSPGSDILALGLIFEEIANSAEFITPDLRYKIENLIYRIQMGLFWSMDQLIDNHQWLYPLYRRDLPLRIRSKSI
jgi:serine/threonine protein kinase